MYMRGDRPFEPLVYRNAVFLASATPAEVSRWLAGRDITYSPTSGTPDTPSNAHVLEYILFRRNDPLIDLALAEHGRSRTVLERVYKRSGSSVRAVACSNASLFVGEAISSFIWDQDEALFWKVIKNGNSAELRALCENPNLSSGMYASLITSWVGNNKSRVDETLRLSNERFQQVVRFLTKNPRLSVDRENSKERYYLDGYADYEYGILFSECWNLAAIAPVDPAWAYYLSQLYERMQPSYNPFDDIESILARWRPTEDEEENRLMRGLREVIAKHYIAPTKETLHHNDEAIRRAFYRTFDPMKEDFIEQDWAAWCKRDKYCEYELQSNEKIWRNNRSRKKLDGLMWELSRENSDMTGVGWFEMRENTYKQEHPEWFANNDTLEEVFDDEQASQDYAANVTAAESLHGTKTFEAEALANEMLGKQMLLEDLGHYGVGRIPKYGLDTDTRDRLIAHTRQDVAAAFGYAKSAFKTAKETEKVSKRTSRALWIVAILMIIGMF